MNDIKSKLEKHFKDAVDFEFTIQNGKLWILNVRPANRTSEANLKITIDLYFEKIIDLNDVISKIQLKDIDLVLLPTINNESELKIIGKGLAASPGATSGKIYFHSDDILRETDKNCIFCRIEVSPEDLEAMRHSSGIITSRGGMTSHAAVVSRGMGIPCITGLGSLLINYKERLLISSGVIINEGDWVTINGSTGNVYFGKGNVSVPNWKNNKYLYIFSRMIEKAICTNTLNNENVGKAWILRDYFLHNFPFKIEETDKKHIDIKEYISFTHPNKNQLDKIYRKLIILNRENEYLSLIIQGLRNSLLRQLSNKIGIGNHYKYYRPILDPMYCINYGTTTREVRCQLIGEEFNNISKYIPNLIDVYKVKLYFEIQTYSENGLSFLDFTNPRGESLILKNDNIISFYLEINDKKIELNELPPLYNKFRKREYFWTWYIENLTSHKEIIEFINKPKKERLKNFRLNTYAHELELLENNSLTKSGNALKY